MYYMLQVEALQPDHAIRRLGLLTNVGLPLGRARPGRDDNVVPLAGGDAALQLRPADLIIAQHRRQGCTRMWGARQLDWAAASECTRCWWTAPSLAGQGLAINAVTPQLLAAAAPPLTSAISWNRLYVYES